MKKILYLIILSFFISFSANASDESNENLKDCWKGFNKATFALNQTLDGILFEPIARGYRHLPSGIRYGTSNMVSNISNLVTIPNNLLQGDFKTAGINTARLSVNTTIGIFGIFDVAQQMGFVKNYKREDYGQTLGKWGVGEGCYLVLPILGPSTARDTIGLLADTFIDPFAHVTIRENELFGASGNAIDYYSVKGTNAVNFRSDNLINLESLEKNSLDLYSSYKSIYLQDRNNKIKNSTEDQDDWGNLDN